MATRSARWWPSDVPGGSVQGDHPLPGEGLGEPDAVAAGLADVGVVHEPVDGGGGQCLGHQLVEPIRGKVRAHGHASFLVGGVYQAVEPFGGVGADRQQPAPGQSSTAASSPSATAQVNYPDRVFERHRAEAC